LNARNILSRSNRGVLLDVLVFALNLWLMRMLTRYFVGLVRLASANDSLAVIQLGLFFAGMLVLPAAGSILKRWDFHYGRGGGRGKRGVDLDAKVWGCLTNPVLYLAVSLVISATVVSLLGGLAFGDAFQNSGAIFVSFILGAIVVSLVQTFFVYRYFSPPKKTSGAFLRDPRAAFLGDACIYLNMILFQVLWNIVGFVPVGRVTDFGVFAGRLFFLCFAALLVYFPPRVFYLAEDGRRPRTWLTMLLANSPVILRVLLGVNLKI
jgi:hypothetical protein